MTDPEVPAAPADRLVSIDALRGFDMLWIIGGDRLAVALAACLVPATLPTLERQFEHLPWEGFTFYDLIFPLFLFLAGAVVPFSLDKLRGQDPAAAYGRVARRTALLFAFGLIYNGVLQFEWDSLRVTGVLQRIAIGYGVAAILALSTPIWGQVLALAATLGGYWAILAYIPSPEGGLGDFAKMTNLSGWIDRHYLPGIIAPGYYTHGDNEGLLSTIPAVGTALMGVLAGHWLRSGRGPWLKVAGLVVAGLATLGGGLYWGRTFPIIKSLWTSSFALVAGGWSLLLLAAFYAVIDVLKLRRWAFPFVVIGANAITIYLVQRVVDFEEIAKFFLEGTARLASAAGGPAVGVVILAAGVLVAKWLLLLVLYRKRIFLRA